MVFPYTPALSAQDPAIANLILREFERQRDGIELIASENIVSHGVLEALGSVLTNKYSEGYPGKRYYGGNEVIDDVERLAIERARTLFGAEYINVQPLSGSPANLAVMLAVLSPGDTILAMSLDHGGHLSHGHALNFSGKYFHPVFYGVHPETHLVDMDEVRRLALECKPKMIIAGFSAYSRSLNWAAFRAIADEVGAMLLADMAHIAGLVAGGVLQNPVPYCDIVTTTTHKTLRGPRGALIMARAQYEKDLARAVFPGVQGGPHDHVTAAKAVAFAEAATPEFSMYARQVVANAQALAAAMQEQGFRVISGGTDNHLMLIDIFGSFGVAGREMEQLCERVGISINKNLIPFDPRKPLDPSGIRIGTPTLTTRGMREADMCEVARFLRAVIDNRTNEVALDELRQEIVHFCQKFPIYQ